MGKVDIIIPTYNRADTVGTAIQSVLDQTFEDWELYIVDDGSNDNTRDVVAAFSDSRVHYIYQDNRQLPGARNTGIRASSGKYVAFLDSDDLFLPNKLELQVAVLDENVEIGLVASGTTEVNAQQRPLRTLRPWTLGQGLALPDWLYNCPVNVLAVLVRREWLYHVGLFDEQQYYVEDWDLWLRLASAGCRMVWAPAIVCLRTVHEDSMVHNAAQMSDGLFRVFSKFFEQPDLPGYVRQQRDQVFANAHVYAAVRFLAGGMRDAGAQHLCAAASLDSALLAGTPPRIIVSLASTALTHTVQDAEQYIADVCRALAVALPGLAYTRRKMRGTVWATAAFENIANGRRSDARRRAVQALLADPTWVCNRGLLRILLKRQRIVH